MSTTVAMIMRPVYRAAGAKQARLTKRAAYRDAAKIAFWKKHQCECDDPRHEEGYPGCTCFWHGDGSVLREAIIRRYARLLMRRDRARPVTCKITVTKIDADMYETTFAVGVQSFGLAYEVGNEAGQHCTFIAEMFRRALGLLGVEPRCKGFTPGDVPRSNGAFMSAPDRLAAQGNGGAR